MPREHAPVNRSKLADASVQPSASISLSPFHPVLNRVASDVLSLLNPMSRSSLPGSSPFLPPSFRPPRYTCTKSLCVYKQVEVLRGYTCFRTQSSLASFPSFSWPNTRSEYGRMFRFANLIPCFMPQASRMNEGRPVQCSFIQPASYEASPPSSVILGHGAPSLAPGGPFTNGTSASKIVSACVTLAVVWP